MHIAERVKKKTGAKWDRDQAGCANEALARQAPRATINVQAASADRLVDALKATGIAAGRAPFSAWSTSHQVVDANMEEMA